MQFADELLALDPRAAEHWHLERLARERVRLVLPLFAVAAFILTIAGFAEGSLPAGVAAAFDVLLVIVVWRLVRDESLRRPLDLAAVLLLAQAAIFASVAVDPGMVIGIGGFMLPAGSLAFRFEARQRLAIAVGGALLGVFAAFLPSLLASLPHGVSAASVTLIVVVIGNIGAAWIGRYRTRREVERFRPAWARDAGRERERSHLRREMDAARAIQLGMLPRGAPQVPGLDVAGASLPASQVGGDYFDFLPLSDGRLAVVVGDVAGHGLASGLLLSGLRSCLRLLRPELDRPAEVLARLDEVVAEAVEPRLLVALLVAVLDPVRGEARVAAAGHPPALLLRNGTLLEVGAPAPPLGTRLAHRFVETRVELRPGDLLALASDGLFESRSGDDEPFGEAFAEVVTAAPAADGAREVCDAVLAAVLRHRDGLPQEDDLTLVIVRCFDPAVAAVAVERDDDQVVA